MGDCTTGEGFTSLDSIRRLDAILRAFSISLFGHFSKLSFEKCKLCLITRTWSDPTCRLRMTQLIILAMS